MNDGDKLLNERAALIKSIIFKKKKNPSELISTHCGVCQSDDGKGTEDRDGAFMSY